MNNRIYKILSPDQWAAARHAGTFEGAPVDLADGFIHFSTAGQVRETAEKHFRGAGDLVLVEFDTSDFGHTLKWEPSRGGDLFPHLYAALDPSLAKRVFHLAEMPDGTHQFPEEL